jgi:PAS domain-containing protein
MSITSVLADQARAKRLGLRAWLAVALGAAGGLLCVLLALGIGERAAAIAREANARVLTRLAADFRERIDYALEQRLSELKLLALRRERPDVARRQGGFDSIAYLEGASLSRPTVVDRGEGTLALAVPLPGRAGALVATLGPAWLEGIRASLATATDAPAELILVDQRGAVIAGPPALRGAWLALGDTRSAAVALERWPDGQRYLVATSNAPGGEAGLGWRSVARLSAAAAQAPAGELQRAILWSGLALTLLGLCAGWVLATRHARPLVALTRAAQKIAAGDDRVELPALDDYEEITRLARALREMLARLRAQSESLRLGREELRRRVHERTAELVRARAELELEVADARLAREELARANERFALALDASGQSLWEYDATSGEMIFSAGWSRLLGGPAIATRAPKSVFLGLVPDGAREQVGAAIDAALEPGAADLRLEHPVIRGDGQTIWMALQACVVERDASGRGTRAMGVYRALNASPGRPARLVAVSNDRRNDA